MKANAGRRAAFFDFDRTLFDGDAGVLFGRELLRMRWRRTLDDRPGTLGWFWRILSLVLRWLGLFLLSLWLKALHRLFFLKRSELVRRAYTVLAGWRLDEVRLLAQDFFDEVIAAKLYPAALDAIQTHRAEGHRVVVVTTNMHLLIDHVRRHAPVDDVIAVHLDARNGLLTGTVHGPLWGEEKAAAVRNYAHAHGLSLPRSFAYSDHYSDVSFLRLVGHPVVVNPSPRLRLHARRRRWDIRRWRSAPVGRRPPAATRAESG